MVLKEYEYCVSGECISITKEALEEFVKMMEE